MGSGDEQLANHNIPGVENVLADLRSRNFKDNLECKLNQEIVDEICRTWETPGVDMFASRLNAKLSKYVSWEPEPDNWRTDTFASTGIYIYCFPSFSLLPRVIRKIQRDGMSVIVVALHWPAQSWYPLLQGEATDSREFPKNVENLIGKNVPNRGPAEEELTRSRLMVYLF